MLRVVIRRKKSPCFTIVGSCLTLFCRTFFLVNIGSKSNWWWDSTELNEFNKISKEIERKKNIIVSKIFFKPTDPSPCWAISLIIVNDNIVCHYDYNSSVISLESHQCWKLSIIHHEHKGGEKKDFWCAIKNCFQQQERQVNSRHGAFLCPIPKKRNLYMNQ